MQAETPLISYEATLLELSHELDLKKMELVAKVIIGTSFLLLILHGTGVISGGRPVTLLIMLLLTIGLGLGWSSTGLEELDHNDQPGVIIFETDKIIWKGIPIPRKHIKKIDVSYSEYRNKLKKKIKNNDWISSSGVNNIIFLTLKDNSRLKGRIYIESRERQLELKRVFWHVIMNNPISIANARRMIQPANKGERNALEQYCV